jgi:hypothetical protein
MREPKCATRWAALLVTQPGTGDWEQLRLIRTSAGANGVTPTRGSTGASAAPETRTAPIGYYFEPSTKHGMKRIKICLGGIPLS